MKKFLCEMRALLVWLLSFVCFVSLPVALDIAVSVVTGWQNIAGRIIITLLLFVVSYVFVGHYIVGKMVPAGPDRKKQIYGWFIIPFAYMLDTGDSGYIDKITRPFRPF